jgi:immunoglobulin-binding protein 1
MADENPMSLGDRFRDAESKRKALDSEVDSNSATYQSLLEGALKSYTEFQDLAERSSLFSPNETLEDIASGDIQYLTAAYYLAELTTRLAGDQSARKQNLEKARWWYRSFLSRLDSYDILSKSDEKLFEQFKDNPDTFSTASTTDAAARRAAKIARFREEKALKQKLEVGPKSSRGMQKTNGRQHLRQNPTALSTDEEALRNLHLTNIAFLVHQTFASLESIAQELQILSMAPPQPPASQAAPHDSRQTGRDGDGYSDRLDGPMLNRLPNSGPLLSKDGKPLRPFTLLDNRQRLRDGVFRPGHNLPTMSIDEYLEEERRRGGIIEGGGEASGRKPEVDEDDMEAADQETMKARYWDEFKEDNPRGSGNTLNRG